MSLTTWFIRRSFRSGDAKRDAGLETPQDIERWNNICYGTSTTSQVMDVYRPKDAGRPLPVIVSVHGGGWTYGSKESYQYYCMDLAQRGFAVINFTYRLAPEHKFPASLEDTCLVFGWLMNRTDCGWFDLSRVAAVGDSAGAHLLTIYCAAAHNAEYEARLGIHLPRGQDGKPFCPSAIGLNCGVYSIDFAGSSSLTRGLVKALLTTRGKSATELDFINPTTYIQPSFPPAFVVTGSQDKLAGPPAQISLTKKLDACGIPYVDRTYGTELNPQPHVFHLDIRNRLGRQCNDEECAWLLEQLYPT